MDYPKWAATWSDSLTQVTERAAAYVPNVLGAVVLVVIGWLVARLLRAIGRRLIAALMRRAAASTAIHRSVERTGLTRTIPQVISAIIFWGVFLLFLAAAIERLELAVVTNLLSSFAFYLPKILLAMLVVFAGFIAGDLAHHAISRGAASAGLGYAPLLGRTAQVVILLVALVMAADQIGIQSTFLMLTISLVVGTTLGGAALAFGLGSGPAVGNLIASYYLAKTYRLGQMVRIDGIEGKIVEMTPSAIVIDSAEGRVLIPAKKFTEQTSILLKGS